MCFFLTLRITQNCKDKLTISYLLSVYFHKHDANLEKHGCLGAKWSGQSESI